MHAFHCNDLVFWPQVNKLKTPPTPNKNGSYGIKVGVRTPKKSEFVCHKSRFIHHILCESPFVLGDFYAYGPSFYGISWEHIFLLIWGVRVVKIPSQQGKLPTELIPQENYLEIGNGLPNQKIVSGNYLGR